MTLGYDKPLYLLAFDHRGERDLIAGHVDRRMAVRTIAERYFETVKGFVG